MPLLKMLIPFPLLLSASAAGARARSPAGVPRLRALPLPAAGRWQLGPAGAGAAPPPLAGPECPLQTAGVGAAPPALCCLPWSAGWEMLAGAGCRGAAVAPHLGAGWERGSRLAVAADRYSPTFQPCCVPDTVCLYRVSHD